jgi:hypothetical protein
MGLVRWVNGWADRLIETSGWRRHPRSKRLQLMVVPWVFGIVGAFALYVIFDSPVLVYLL